MSTFKIRDLIVTLDPGGAMPGERHRTLAQAYPEVPTGPGAAEYLACGASPEPDLVIAVSPAEAIERSGEAELLLLKKQLQDLLMLVERREGELGQGTGKAPAQPTQKDLKGWETKLSKALLGVRSMIAKKSKSGSKNAGKKGSKKKAGPKKT